MKKQEPGHSCALVWHTLPPVRIRSLVIPGLVAVLIPAALGAQVPALGPELRINTYTTGDQAYASISTAADGCFIVAWESFEQDGSQLGVFARVYGPDGLPNTAEIPVNTTTAGAQQRPAIACRPDCDFVVVWQGEGDGSSDGIFGQRFSEFGNPLGVEFAVNEFTTSTQSFPAAAIDAAGAFVVVWQSFSEDGSGFSVVGRRFAANGTPLAGDFVVNTTTSGNQTAPVVATTGDGAFVVAWQTPDDGDFEGIRARRYDASGNPVSSEIPVNAFTTGPQIRPSVAIDESGAFVVSWESVGQDGEGSGVFARRFDSLGLPLTGELAVNTHTSSDQSRPRVAPTTDGGFLVAWDGAGSGGAGSDLRVWMRRFTPSNTAPDDAFQLNVFTATNSQSRPALATDPRGGFAVAWQSLEQDGDGFGIYGRRGGFPEAGAIAVDERAPSSGSSNQNGVLEAGETVTVDPAWRNGSIENLPLAGTASSFDGPPGPVYTLIDGEAGYGTLAAGTANECFSATGDCYEMSVTGARPAPHWDAAFVEDLPDVNLQKTWTLHVGESFADVPASSLFYRFVEAIFHGRITAGGFCGGYCPGDATLRKQMAVFVLKAKEGPFFVPPPATGVFNDVPASNPFAPWIEELFRRGVVAGCAAPGGPNYCPDDPVLRQQMAVFLLRTLEGPAYDPPDCAGVFEDVPCPGLFTDFIEELAARQIAAGCGGEHYCPSAVTTRGQMAAFLTKTFGLELYGP